VISAEFVAAPTMVSPARQLESAARDLRGRVRGEVRVAEPMARHTTFHIGGPADLFLVPTDVDDLVEAIRFARRQGLPLKLLGNGSNLLVGDGGIRGLVVRLAPHFSRVTWQEAGAVVGAGARLGKLLRDAAQAGLSGLESMISIPGTVGGALVMNAGTDTGSISDLVTAVTVVDETGEVRRLDACDLAYRYRHSAFHDGRLVIVEAELGLTPAAPDDILAKMARLRAKREGRQPLRSWSAGCAFKNPEGVAAGKVLERAGAKGMRVGDAEVSRKHANFIVNRRHATAAEVRELIARAHALAKRRYEIELELEVEMVGVE
jgi:UDP-N-acetylmuramate dehydrogenase